MSVPKHTPGPWVAVGHEVHDSRSAFDASGARIGNTPNRICGVEYPYGDSAGKAANAHLVAAAPDLLEACQTFAEWLRREDEGLPGGIERGTPEGERRWRAWWSENLRICALAKDQVRAAIAKATGGGA